MIETPYILFLGDVHDDLAATTAFGITDWRPDWCIGQVRLPGCRADTGLPDMTIAEAADGGAQTFVIGVVNSGAVEWLSPEAADDHWDVIEGQGSLFHPAFAGVSLGLLLGAQPDAFIVCHEPARTTMRNVKHPLPAIAEHLLMLFPA